jgi:hypothetical protein
VSPYSSMHSVRRQAVHAALAARDSGDVDLSWAARQAISCCTAWCAHFARLEPHYPDHYCRITRQRVAKHCPPDECHNVSSASQLPMPPSSYPPRHFRFRNTSTLRYTVRAHRADTLWHRHLGGRRIDFLKVDVDRSWLDIGLDGLIVARGFTVMVIEVDNSWGVSVVPAHLQPRWNLSAVDQLAWIARKHGYDTFLKVPCRAQPAHHTAARGLPRDKDQGWSSWMYPLATPRSAFVPSGASTPTMRATGGAKADVFHGIQDLLLVDSSDRSLSSLPDLAMATCLATRRGHLLHSKA